MINISFWNILWTVVNLLILFIAFRIFFFKPIANIIAKRQEEVEASYKAASDKEQEAEEAVKQYQNKLDAVEEEKKQILSDTRKQADEQYQKLVADAKTDAKSIKDAAVAEANQEREKIIAGAKKEIADIVMDATEKVVGSKTGSDVDHELFNKFLGENGE